MFQSTAAMNSFNSWVTVASRTRPGTRVSIVMGYPKIDGEKNLEHPNLKWMTGGSLILGNPPCVTHKKDQRRICMGKNPCSNLLQPPSLGRITHLWPDQPPHPMLEPAVPLGFSPLFGMAWNRSKPPNQTPCHALPWCRSPNWKRRLNRPGLSLMAHLGSQLDHFKVTLDVHNVLMCCNWVRKHVETTRKQSYDHIWFNREDRGQHCRPGIDTASWSVSLLGN
jgi:hypothetical protein